MAKYRKLPVEIEARQWTGENTGEITTFCGMQLIKTSPDKLTIGTLEGPHEASIGDYIICGLAGEFYPCKPGIFIQTYEPVKR